MPPELSQWIGAGLSGLTLLIVQFILHEIREIRRDFQKHLQYHLDMLAK